MKRTMTLGLMMLVSTTLPSLSAWAADPTLHEVYQAAEAGNLKQSESMMDQVLRDHPNSAKAHFVEAQILAREGRLDAARTELATAERLAPGLPFAKPGSVRELKARLQVPAAAAPVAAAGSPAQAAPAIPWGMLVLGALLVAAIVFFIRALNRQRIMPSAGVATYGAGGGMAQPYGVGGAGPMAPPSAGIGSGLLGGLATGAAVGAGVVAGEALMHRLLDGGSHADAPLASAVNVPMQSDYDMGGADFGVGGDASWDDTSAGGDDWS